MVSPDVQYVLIEEEEEAYILAEKAVPRYYKKGEKANIVKRFPGKELDGLEYDKVEFMIAQSDVVPFRFS